MKSEVRLLALMLFSLFTFNGCHSICSHFAYSDCLDRAFANCYARHRAAKAWRDFSCHCVPDDPHIHYYKDGFLDGFTDVANGGKGCLPAIPPRRYWKSCYETAEGRLKICAYFQGYSAGVQAAFETGNARSTRFPTPTHPYVNPDCPSCPPNALEPSLESLQDGELLMPGARPIPPAPPGDLSGNDLSLPSESIRGSTFPSSDSPADVPRLDQLFAPDLK